jgi:hypothetical protein
MLIDLSLIYSTTLNRGSKSSLSKLLLPRACQQKLPIDKTCPYHSHHYVARSASTKILPNSKWRVWKPALCFSPLVRGVAKQSFARGDSNLLQQVWFCQSPNGFGGDGGGFLPAVY